MAHPLGLIVAAAFDPEPEAACIERKLKAWKNPAKAISFLQQLAAGQEKLSERFCTPKLA